MSARGKTPKPRSNEYTIRLLEPHPKQVAFIESKAKRKVIRAGRRGGKTVGSSIIAVQYFLAGHRVLYAAPTQDQVSAFWHRVTEALYEPIQGGVFRKNETMHLIELERTEQRVKAKTAWNADTLRGDYADLLILDEFQLMNEDAWELVGAPMLLDNNGDAIFIYTPPSLHSRSASKANDPQHAAKMFKAHEHDTDGRWETCHFSSMDNPTISREALSEISRDMTDLAYRMEILAEDVDEAPGALWKRHTIEKHRLPDNAEYDLGRIVIGVDPTGSKAGDECGIVAAGRTGNELYVLADYSLHGSPQQWATAAVNAYHDLQADCIVAEKNYGGEMVEYTIHTIDQAVPVISVDAVRGKAVRAEPIAAIYEQGRAHHVGSFPTLEDEMCLWIPGDKSPNRMDAMVWSATNLMLGFFRAPDDPGWS
jgi:hypothetical protein